MFVTTVVVATVAILTGFKMTRRPFLRDVFLYMAAVAYMLAIVVRRTDGRRTQAACAV
jgi:Ca2+/Na+ antiporter